MASSVDTEYGSTVAGESEHSYICLSCEADGKKLKAVGYCVHCKEYLCRRCFDAHLIPTVTRRHRLLDEEHMEEIKAIDKSLCLEHRDKRIEYYCPTHSFFGCHTCFFKHQKTCKDVLSIPEVSENITNTEEYKLFKERLNSIVTKCTQYVTEVVKGERETIAAKHAGVIASIKEFKREILDAIEKQEKELLKKADRMKQEEAAKLAEMYEKCNDILMETQAIASTTEALKNKQNKDDLYMTMMHSKDRLLSSENVLHTINTKICSNQFIFSANDGLIEMLKRPFGLGELSQSDTITKVEHVQDISIKAGDDTRTCRPTGAVLLPGRKLVIADINNAKLKLLDTCTNKLVSELKFSKGLLAVCQVTVEQVAVTTFNERKVAFVRTSPSLSVDRTVSVDGACYGVGYCDGKLVVSYASNKVEVIDIQGNVLNRFETDENGKALFNGPFQLTVHPENKLIYVSNCGGNNVICMKFDGTVVGRYADSELQGSYQTVFKNRYTAFVCGRDSHNIHQITEGCKKTKVLLTNANGLCQPESISYSEREGKLYIGMMGNDVLKVFQVTHAIV